MCALWSQHWAWLQYCRPVEADRCPLKSLFPCCSCCCRLLLTCGCNLFQSDHRTVFLMTIKTGTRCDALLHSARSLCLQSRPKLFIFTLVSPLMKLPSLIIAASGKNLALARISRPDLLSLNTAVCWNLDSALCVSVD